MTSEKTKLRATIRRPACLLLAVLLVLLLTSAAVPLTASAGEGMGFDVQPAAGTEDAKLGYFRFDASPGETVTRTIMLKNLTQDKKLISLAPCDGTAAAYGGIAYSASDKKPSGVGAWLDLSSASVTLDPGATVAVDFQVRVPGDVASGAHIAGIAAWEPAAAETSGSDPDTEGASTQITMVTRKVLTVYVTTPGQAVPKLTVSGVKPEARPDGMYLLIGIDNEGTAITTAEGVVRIPATGFSQTFSVGQLVPTAAVRYPVPWTTDPAEGSYATEVEIAYADGAETATWADSFTIAGEETAALEDRLVTTDVGTGAAAGGTPWLLYGLVGGLVVVVAVMGLALMRRRRPAPRQ